jgi:hypothetical protein
MISDHPLNRMYIQHLETREMCEEAILEEEKRVAEIHEGIKSLRSCVRDANLVVEVWKDVAIGEMGPGVMYSLSEYDLKDDRIGSETWRSGRVYENVNTPGKWAGYIGYGRDQHQRGENGYDESLGLKWYNSRDEAETVVLDWIALEVRP